MAKRYFTIEQNKACMDHIQKLLKNGESFTVSPDAGGVAVTS